MTNDTTDGPDVIRLRLTFQQASLLIDILAQIEAAIWDVHGDQLASLAQLEDEVDARIETHARERTDADDIPF